MSLEQMANMMDKINPHCPAKEEKSNRMQRLSSSQSDRSWKQKDAENCADKAITQLRADE